MLRDFVYPMELDGSGDIKVTEDYPTLVKQAIIHSLNTIRGEMVWYPSQGRLYMVFDAVQDVPATLAEIRQVIQRGLTGYSDVTFQLFSRFDSESQMSVIILYQCPSLDPTRLEVTVPLR